MEELRIKDYMSMKEIFACLISVYKSEGMQGFYHKKQDWCIYVNNDPVTADTQGYVDEYPYYDDDDNEILSDYVAGNDMYMLYRDEMVEDVVASCIDQKENASFEEIMEALIYYDKNDNFMNLA